MKSGVHETQTADTRFPNGCPNGRRLRSLLHLLQFLDRLVGRDDGGGLAWTPVAMASNLMAVASKVTGMASNLIAMASDLVAVAWSRSMDLSSSSVPRRDLVHKKRRSYSGGIRLYKTTVSARRILHIPNVLLRSRVYSQRLYAIVHPDSQVRF